MCARRFLVLIFILTLLTVGGAFALYQWGDQVLVRMATPQGHYQEPPKGSGPDYSKERSWLANSPRSFCVSMIPVPSLTARCGPLLYLLDENICICNYL